MYTTGRSGKRMVLVSLYAVYGENLFILLPRIEELVTEHEDEGLFARVYEKIGRDGVPTGATLYGLDMCGDLRVITFVDREALFAWLPDQDACFCEECGLPGEYDSSSHIFYVGVLV